MKTHYVYSNFLTTHKEITQTNLNSHKRATRIEKNVKRRENSFLLTGLHHVIQSWEASVNPGADGAQDQDRGQVGVSHESSPQQPASLVLAVHISRHNHHQVVRQREAGVLAPPAVEGHGYIEACNRKK